jgi:hypothetical protein
MFTVAAFLPFLPLIEEAAIRQLKCHDRTSREAAMQTLTVMLRDTDGIRQYWVLDRVKKERDTLEIRTEAEKLYVDHRSKYIQGHPFVFVVFALDKEEQRSRKSLTETVNRLQKETGGGADDGLLWDNKHYLAGNFVTPETLLLFRKLKNHPRFKEFVSFRQACMNHLG